MPCVEACCRVSLYSPKLIVTFKRLFKKSLRFSIQKEAFLEFKNNHDVFCGRYDIELGLIGFSCAVEGMHKAQMDVLSRALLDVASGYIDVVKSIDIYTPEWCDITKFSYTHIDLEQQNQVYASLELFIPNVYSWKEKNELFTVARFNFEKTCKFVIVNYPGYETAPYCSAKIPKFKISNDPQLALTQLCYYVPNIKPNEPQKYACTIDLENKEVRFG